MVQYITHFPSSKPYFKIIPISSSSPVSYIGGQGAREHHRTMGGGRVFSMKLLHRSSGMSRSRYSRSLHTATEVSIPVG